ncbi:DUF2811 domain-containing protein [Cyanobium sp. T1G-Tous]|nr:DUF2811 domain-containing protein [Cyanobium sp. T1G-Tous]MCP9777339.1 DUF2811 domain-containing protein [Cyanobium sp. Tous-M-B4]MCP9802272.1 DUF2811 domain-containing protein [Cyanobium sp. T1G-Tous]MCP9875712.1 DUF2811 domain-containing protein [Cyanobium sp. A2C-AMD]
MTAERSHLQRCMEQPSCAEVLVEAEAGSISLEAEVPEVLFDGMREFLRSHPQWDQYRLISSALSSFLFQHGCADKGVSQHYLNGLFLRR